MSRIRPVRALWALFSQPDSQSIPVNGGFRMWSRSTQKLHTHKTKEQGTTASTAIPEGRTPSPTEHPSGPRQPKNSQGRAIRLGTLCNMFKAAAQRGEAEKAMSLLQSYHRQGGAAQLWMFDMLINMYARQRDMASALAIEQLMRSHGIEPSLHVYNSLLAACSHAQHTGYNLPAAAVDAAEGILAQIKSEGLVRDRASYGIAMDVFAKAGMPSKAEKQLQLMEAAGIPAQTREYTMLMDGYKRCQQPAAAANVMHVLMPQAGLVPDTHAWNALLGAHGRNGDMDSAYATWQDMMQNKVMPSDVTERELAEAFSSSPAFAADVVQQCRSFRHVLEAGAQTSSSAAAPHSGLSSLLLSAFHLQGWLNWLRHGARHPAAAPHTPLLSTRPRRSAPSPSSPAGEEGPAARAAAAAASDVILDVHRMNQAQARAAVLQHLHTLSSAMPSGEVERARYQAAARAVGMPTDSPTNSTRSSTSSSSSGLSTSAEHLPAPAAPPDTPESHPAGPDALSAELNQGTPAAALRGAAANGARENAADATLPGRPLVAEAQLDTGAVKHQMNGSSDAIAHVPGKLSRAEDSGTVSVDGGEWPEDAGHPAGYESSDTSNSSPSASSSQEPGSGLTSEVGTETHSMHRAQAEGPIEEEDPGGLLIIVGRGRTGRAQQQPGDTADLDRNPLRLAVEDLLQSLQVPWQEVPHNRGRLRVARQDVLSFAARSAHRGEEHAMMRRMLFRALLLGAAAGGALQMLSDPTWIRLWMFVEDNGVW